MALRQHRPMSDQSLLLVFHGKLVQVSGDHLGALRLGVPSGDVGRLPVQLSLGDAVPHPLSGLFHLSGGAQAIKGRHTGTRARGPYCTMAVEDFVLPADPGPILCRNPRHGLAMAAPAEIELPLAGATVQIVDAGLEAALATLFITRYCCHMFSFRISRRAPPRTFRLRPAHFT